MDVDAKKYTTQEELRSKVVKFAICTRLTALLISFVSNIAIPDHNPDVFLFPEPRQKNETIVDKSVTMLFGGLVRWDAQYFLHIAHYGYTYENTLAFFPLFPVLSRLLGQLLDLILYPILNSFSTVLISAVVINLVFFIGAAVMLFQLSCIALQNNRLAYIAALFFCVNPASIFFTAPYSESCFSLFTFSGMFYSLKYGTNLFSSVASCLSVCARSNGIINFGFIAHKIIRNMTLKLGHSFKLNILIVCINIFSICLYFSLFVSPIVLFHYFIYLKYCLHPSRISHFLKDFGQSKGYEIPGEFSPPWCNHSVPISYSHVQSHYWKVGFLRYYELKQIPNFLLALPVVYLILSNSYFFIVENKRSLLSLGFDDYECVSFKGKTLRPEVFVHVVHALVLTLFCALFIHVQVTTRMIASACPVLYWFVALNYHYSTSRMSDAIPSRLKVIKNANKYSFVETQSNLNSFWKTVIFSEDPIDRGSYILKLYFISYFIIGTVLFSNFYPWT